MMDVYSVQVWYEKEDLSSRDVVVVVVVWGRNIQIIIHEVRSIKYSRVYPE